VEPDNPVARSSSLPSLRFPACPHWDILDSLARVVDPIPKPSQQTVRYWGFYANTARGKRHKAESAVQTTREPLRQVNGDELRRRARLTWANLIHRVYEVDPLLCPFCGAEMRTLAFILDVATARAIRRNLKLPAQEPEPLAHGAPRDLELPNQTPESFHPQPTPSEPSVAPAKCAPPPAPTPAPCPQFRPQWHPGVPV